jgi:phosphoglycerate dehydrogenase-like enzyme
VCERLNDPADNTSVGKTRFTAARDENDMDADNRLLILSRSAAAYADLIKDLRFPDLEIVACKTAGEASAHMDRCTVILGEPSRIARVLEGATVLRWVQSTFAGVEELLRPGARSDYVLTGVKGVFGPFMSEYVMGYILALERHFFAAYRNQQNRNWRRLPYNSLRGRLIGICGLGSIGRHLARTAEHFGLRVWGFKRTAKTVLEAERVFTGSEFDEFLSQPDYIVNTLPSTPATMHLFGEPAFRAMKKTAVLINIGRGDAVVEEALIRALQQGLIGGAVLDVFEQEPLPEDSPLWTLSNVVITPHNSGFSFPGDIVALFAENYRRFSTGDPLLYRVDFERGY